MNGLGSFSLQRLGSMAMTLPAVSSDDDDDDYFLEMLQDNEEVRALEAKKNKTRVKPTWE